MGLDDFYHPKFPGEAPDHDAPPDDSVVGRFPVPAYVEYLEAGSIIVVADRELGEIRELLGAVTVQRAIDDALAHLVVTRREQVDPPPELDEDEWRRYPPPDEAWVIAEGTARRVLLDPDVIDELCRLAPDPRQLDALGWATEIGEALRAFAAHTRALQAAAPRGSLSPPVEPWRPPAAVDPVLPDEAVSLFRRLRSAR